VHLYIGKHFNSTSHSSDTWDIIPLSPVCNPTANFSASNTSSNDWT
jgi:hypothetical protein